MFTKSLVLFYVWFTLNFFFSYTGLSEIEMTKNSLATSSYVSFLLLKFHIYIYSRYIVLLLCPWLPIYFNIRDQYNVIIISMIIISKLESRLNITQPWYTHVQSLICIVLRSFIKSLLLNVSGYRQGRVYEREIARTWVLFNVNLNTEDQKFSMKILK